MNVCEAAIDVIEKRGWIQGRYADFNGVCLLGALNKAACASTGLDTQAYINGASAVRTELIEHHGMAAMDQIAGWNDAPGRTVDEVIEVLRYAAKREAGLR